MWRVALVVLVLAAVPASAQDRLDALAAALDRATATPQAEAAGLARMATFLGTSPDALRGERASTRFGWGDLFMSHRIATRGGHPLEKVFAARRTGAPWGAIAEEARVDADTLVQDAATVWPDATRPSSASGDAAGASAPPASAPPTPPAPPAPERNASDRARDEIRDRMIRGGGRGW